MKVNRKHKHVKSPPWIFFMMGQIDSKDDTDTVSGSEAAITKWFKKLKWAFGSIPM